MNVGRESGVPAVRRQVLDVDALQWIKSMGVRVCALRTLTWTNVGRRFQSSTHAFWASELEDIGSRRVRCA